MTATLTPLANNTDVGETIGGKFHGRTLFFDAAGSDAMGLVAASPAANTFLGRLKAIADAILGMAPASDVYTVAPSDSVALAPTPRALIALTDGNVAVRGTGANAVTIPVKAGQQLNIKALYVYQTGTTASVAALV